MILQIAFQAELKEEQERKRLLKEQSDADRVYLLELSSKEAAERARLLQQKKNQEESDAAISRVLTELQESELAQQEIKTSASKTSKKVRGAVKSAVDRKWDEIDRKRFAARMIGRSDPAPITKVKLKKSKNQSQPQLLIERGSETQAMLLDQVCKLHREEWNEIRLAISHSTSAAKAEVLKEIDRLFQKMVSLQLLRPEDTVIFGEEIVQPPSLRYRSGTSSIHRIPNTSKLNLSIPAGVPKLEGHEVTEEEKGLVYRDLNGALRFQREAELEKVDQEQLIHLIRSASMLPTTSKIRKAILDEALARTFRYLPSQDKYELEAELGIVKEEEMWRDK